MSPVENGKSSDEACESGGEASLAPSAPVVLPSPAVLVDPKGAYLVVSWDLDTTGRRLLDEICQIGGFFHPPGGGGGGKVADEVAEGGEEEKKAAAAKEAAGGGRAFSQYVMPYKNPNPGARRSFGIRVVNIGRYRMLKDMETGKILKTKSEISALQEFIDWLKSSAAECGKSGGVLLACHEPTRKVLVPLLLEALYKYNLINDFKSTVKGFVNGVHVVTKFGDPDKITSLSLRSLCKTVLADTNPSTSSASDRSRVLVDILGKLVGCGGGGSSGDDPRTLDGAKVATVAVTVASEEEDLRRLKGMLGTQGTLRPIFESQLRQKRSVREHAMALRKVVAESGLNYASLAEIYKGEDAKQVLVKRLKGAQDSDVDELVELLRMHFDEVSVGEERKSQAKPKGETKQAAVEEEAAEGGEEEGKDASAAVVKADA